MVKKDLDKTKTRAVQNTSAPIVQSLGVYLIQTYYLDLNRALGGHMQ